MTMNIPGLHLSIQYGSSFAHNVHTGDTQYKLCNMMSIPVFHSVGKTTGKPYWIHNPPLQQWFPQSAFTMIQRFLQDLRSHCSLLFHDDKKEHIKSNELPVELKDRIVSQADLGNAIK